MFTISVKDIFSEKLSHDDYEDCCIYVIRDGSLILYIGQSCDVIRRLKEHVGLNVKGFGIKISIIGRLINANLPDSGKWQIDLLTLKDCKTYTVFTLSVKDVNQAETQLIKLLCPCLNQTLNRRRHGINRLTGYKQPWKRKITEEMLSFLDN